MDFGKSLISSLIFDIALPIVAGVVKANTGSGGEAISEVINASTGVIKDSVNAALDGTSFQTAAPKIFNDHLADIISSIQHVAQNHSDLPHNQQVLKATDHLGQLIQK